MWFRKMILLLILATSPLRLAAGEPDARHWFGRMDVGERVFRFRVEPVALPGGQASGHQSEFQLVSLDEGGQAFPLDDFKVDDTRLSFAINATKAQYSGSKTPDQEVYQGTWTQRGAAFSLDMGPCEPGFEDPAPEVWAGTIDALFQKLQLRVRVYPAADGREQVFLDSVTQKAGGIKAVRTIEGEHWTISIKSLSATFAGTVNSDHSEVQGRFTQGGIPLDLTLRRVPGDVSEAPVKPNRPQTPQPPFPYATEDVHFRNEADDVVLAGTLCLPSSDRNLPAVVLVSGSGPQDRDETLLDHKPFLVIADHLARQGIAVLRYDDRGTAESTGDFSAADSRDFARDAAAAIRFLRADQRIDPARIGIIGHSEGGLIAPLVAAEDDRLAFIVLLAGTGVNGREILISQGQLIARAAGINDEKELLKQRHVTMAVLDAVDQSVESATVESIVAEIQRRLADVLPPDELTSAESMAQFRTAIEQFRSPWFRFFVKHEPGPVLQSVRCPVLALNGEKDVQVDPKLNLPAIRSALAAGGNAVFEVQEIAGVNHLFQSCTTGGVSEYQQIEQTIDPNVLDTITNWIRSRISD